MGLLRQSAAPFSSRHRLGTTTGDIRNVVVVGDAVTDAEGRITAALRWSPHVDLSADDLDAFAAALVTVSG